ncbi:hypothetical protein [Epibacterium ulvae]|uniref:hypothetical protein n=1 Tax=Epibacterium ulvae TaxID=1156985 RepID=UPI002493AD0E|nr:hypothetical protein [Epibacterium ulvae]
MEQSATLKAKLGFEGEVLGLLDAAAPLIVDTLEVYGHDILSSENPTGHTLVLDTDEYCLELRRRRKLTHGWRSPHTLGDTLELRLTPLYPMYNDQELSETLLACLLHALAVTLPIRSVHWLDWPTELTADQFLSVFETPFAKQDIIKPTPVSVSNTAGRLFHRDTPLYRATTFGKSSAKPAPTQRAPRFAPIDQTAEQLALQCDLRLKSAAMDQAQSVGSGSWKQYVLDKLPQHVATFALTAIMATVSAPAAILAGAVNLIRGSDLRFSLQLLVLLTLALYLDSAGMVRAALSLLPALP